MRQIDFKALFLALFLSYGLVWLLTRVIVEMVVNDDDMARGGVYGGVIYLLAPVHVLLPPALSGYLAARLAQHRPWFHVAVVALLGCVAFAYLSTPGWFGLLTLPLVAIGGLIRTHRLKPKT